MSDWLPPALDYIVAWIDFQREMHDQPGVSLAIAHRGKLVREHASGAADLATGEKLTPRHRFRVASHSKTFTAAGILRLREMGRLRLDDAVGAHVSGLSADVAGVTLSQLLSHSAGLARDGADGGQFLDRRPFLDEAELRADLAAPPPLPPGVAFKYSNHGFALLGKVIEAVTGQSYRAWMSEHIIAAADLRETTTDHDASLCRPFASGHSARHPLGRRFVIPGDNPARDMASATGFVATAADLALFFASLSPAAETSPLTPASRRDMTRRHWRDAHSPLEIHYGLGTISGPPGPWSWVGHSGGFQGTITRAVVLPEQHIAISILTNAIDGLAGAWLEGAMHILKTFHEFGAPSAATAAWRGRWWSLWGAFDLIAGARMILLAQPSLLSPFAGATELEPTGPDAALVAKASGFAYLGEACRLVRDAAGAVERFEIGSGALITEAALEAEIRGRYQPVTGT